MKPSVYVSNFNWIWTVNYLLSKENLFSELKRNCSLLLSEANTSVAFTYTKYSFGFIYSFWVTGIQKQLEETELANFCQLQPEQLPSSGIFSLYIKTLAKTDMVENMDFCVDLRTPLQSANQQAYYCLSYIRDDEESVTNSDYHFKSSCDTRGTVRTTLYAITESMRKTRLPYPFYKDTIWDTENELAPDHVSDT